MSTDPKEAVSRLRDLGLLKTQGLIGGNWIDAYDGKTFEVYFKLEFTFFFFLMCVDYWYSVNF